MYKIHTTSMFVFIQAHLQAPQNICKWTEQGKKNLVSRHQNP